jgi:hypothetical protein
VIAVEDVGIEQPRVNVKLPRVTATEVAGEAKEASKRLVPVNFRV